MQPARTSAKRKTTPGHRSVFGWVALPVCLVLITYVWFISAGLWVTWPRTAVYDYYNSLAGAFQVGQLHLQDQPSAELLALPDPYRIGARKNVEHIWDATLYQGNYYLYWGPVPALLLIPVRSLFEIKTVPDLYLAFACIVGMLLVTSRLLWRVWTRFFRGLPPWTLSLAIIVSGLAPPLAWMLNRPEVYEAALAAGQLFLLWGLYLCYSVLDDAPRPATRLALASLSLGLAIGCRTSDALPAVFIALVMTIVIWREHGGQAIWISAPSRLVAMWLPLVVVVLGVLWYNLARFGSVLEFGYRYQLTLLQMPKHYDELFSTAYMLPNLYNYFLNPFTIAADFPMIRPQYGSTDLGTGISFPRIYFSEAITGLVYTFPFMIFAAGLLPSPGRYSGRTEAAGITRPMRALDWLRVLLLGILALEFAALLLFFFATERYLVETVPSLALAACIGWWRLWLEGKPIQIRTRWIALIGILLAVISVACTTLLAVSSYQERVRTFNPGFIAMINNLLQR